MLVSGDGTCITDRRGCRCGLPTLPLLVTVTWKGRKFATAAHEQASDPCPVCSDSNAGDGDQAGEGEPSRGRGTLLGKRDLAEEGGPCWGKGTQLDKGDPAGERGPSWGRGPQLDKGSWLLQSCGKSPSFPQAFVGTALSGDSVGVPCHDQMRSRTPVPLLMEPTMLWLKQNSRCLVVFCVAG